MKITLWRNIMKLQKRENYISSNLFLTEQGFLLSNADMLLIPIKIQFWFLKKKNTQKPKYPEVNTYKARALQLFLEWTHVARCNSKVSSVICCFCIFWYRCSKLFSSFQFHYDFDPRILSVIHWLLWQSSVLKND